MENDYQALKDKISERLEKANPFEQYGFLRNPFPKAGEPTAEPFHNQDEVRRAFEAKLLSFVQTDGEGSDRLLIYGAHRVGKTNFLTHWQLMISRLLEDGVLGGFIPVYLSVACDNFVDDIHTPLVIELSKTVFLSFFETILRSYDPATLNVGGDLPRAIAATIKRDSSQPQMFVDDADVRLFTKWFSGERCTQNELKALGGVFSNVETSSLAIKYFRDFIKLARRYSIAKGLVVFLDEFELIFGKAMTPSKRARYLLDLRHFMDMLQEGLLLVVASSPGILAELQREYLPLKNRFGETYELQTIRSLEEARGYAKAYLDFGHEIYKRATGKSDGFETLISDEEIAAVFEEVQKEHEGAQGWFFAGLHDNVEEKVRRQEVT